MRRDVEELGELEGSTKLVRKLEVAGCCVAICWYEKAGGSQKSVELSCDIVQA